LDIDFIISLIEYCMMREKSINIFTLERLWLV
jgi:hypothetical protein